MGVLAAVEAHARPPKPSPPAEDTFGADVQLAPFVVLGQQLTVSVHARSKRDRRYAEAFTEAVVKVVYEGVTEQTGKGLVIVGAKGEPHPLAVFSLFERMAAAGRLHPEVAATTQQLNAYLEELKTSWSDQTRSHDEGSDDSPDTFTFDVEEVIQAFPLPLEGVASRLYQIAWAERFDEAGMSARFQGLTLEDLQADPFVKFDWVFYLPARGALDRVLNVFIAEALKQQDIGFLARAASKSALVIARPFIRRAIEGMRKGVLFMTIVGARTDYEPRRVSAMMEAYVETMMPGSQPEFRGSSHDRAVAAVRRAREGHMILDTAAEPGSRPNGAALGEAELALDGVDGSEDE